MLSLFVFSHVGYAEGVGYPPPSIRSLSTKLLAKEFYMLDYILVKELNVLIQGGLGPSSLTVTRVLRTTKISVEYMKPLKHYSNKAFNSTKALRKRGVNLFYRGKTILKYLAKSYACW